MVRWSRLFELRPAWLFQKSRQPASLLFESCVWSPSASCLGFLLPLPSSGKQSGLFASFGQCFLDPFFQLLGVVGLPFQFPHEENVQEHRCRKNYDELELKFMFHFLLLSLGAKAKEHCMGKAHVQPELASGINSIPPAGMALIQQPGRLTLVILLNFPVEGR